MNSGILIATYSEAVPFLRKHKQHCIEEKPFPVYQFMGMILTISGIGKANSAIATSSLITRHGVSRLFNLGSAGATSNKFKIGDILHINMTIEYDSRENEKPEHKLFKPDIINGFSSATLSTHNTPVIEPRKRREAGKISDLVDMEGAPFVQCCRAYSAEAYLFKVVSDTPEHSDIKEIIRNIKATREKMYSFFMDSLKDT